MKNGVKLNKIVVCPNCSSHLLFEDEERHFEDYFYSKEFNCNNCNSKIDLWEAINKLFDSTFMDFSWHYSLLGCQGNVERIVLKPNEKYILDLSGDIKEGELLYINYTPESAGLFPIEIHSNVPTPHIRRKRISLWPQPIKKDVSETNINILYWFAPKELKDDLSIMLLLDAFQRFYEKNYRYMVISAHTSVEILQYSFFEKLLKSISLGNKKIDDFLVNNATFGSQLSILLPMVTKIMGFPLPSNQILEGIKNLQKIRNDVVHRGEPKKGWDEKQLVNALISAFFASKYYKYFINKLFSE